MRISLTILWLCLVSTSLGQNWTAKGEILPEPGVDYSFGYGVDMNDNGNTVIISIPFSDSVGFVIGSARVFDWSGLEWNQRGLDLSTQLESDLSVSKVALSKDGLTAVLSVSTSDGNGRVEVHEWNGFEWQLKGIPFTGDNPLGGSQSIDINGDGTILVIGEYRWGGAANFTPGRVRTFIWTNEAWQDMGAIIYGSEHNDECGFEVSLSYSGMDLVFSDLYYDAGVYNGGRARGYHFDNGVWTQKGDDILGLIELEHIGISISLDSAGNRMAVGYLTYNYDGGFLSPPYGKVQIFDFSNEWEIVGQELLYDEEGDAFGTAVDLSADGSNLLVGASQNTYEGPRNGYAKMYSLVDSNWQQLGQTIHGDSLEILGWSCAISSSGQDFIIGRPEFEFGFRGMGGASVYEFDQANEIEFNEPLDFIIYPVPVINEKLNLRLQGSHNQVIVSIYSIDGRFHSQQHVSAIDIVSIDPPSHPGIYQISIASHETISVKSFIVQ